MTKTVRRGAAIRGEGSSISFTNEALEAMPRSFYRSKIQTVRRGTVIEITLGDEVLFSVNERVDGKGRPTARISMSTPRRRALDLHRVTVFDVGVEGQTVTLYPVEQGARLERRPDRESSRAPAAPAGAFEQGKILTSMISQERLLEIMLDKFAQGWQLEPIELIFLRPRSSVEVWT